MTKRFRGRPTRRQAVTGLGRRQSRPAGQHHPSVAVVHQDLARPGLARDLRDVPEGFVDPRVAVEHRATTATDPSGRLTIVDGHGTFHIS